MEDKNHSQDLIEIRKQINELDRASMNILFKRLELAKQVGIIKRENSTPVTDMEREMAVIRETQQLFDIAMKHKIESIMNTVMRISRETQYEILYENDTRWELGDQISLAVKDIIPPGRVACLGKSGSYSHLTAARIFPDALLIPVQTFGETFQKVVRGDCEYAILPLDNTTAGTVNDVYDLLAATSVYIIKSVSVPIDHKLIFIKGSNIDMIKTVVSHPQALAQCSKFIRKMGWAAISVENTAFAVQQMMEQDDPSVCAIGSNEAAIINELIVSDELICDSIHNQTRFVAISNTLTITNSADRISIAFHLPHQSGSLASVLNLFAERGLNLTKIQSRPVPDKPWEYSFLVDLTAKQGDKDAILALYQLSKELPYLKLIGWYDETAICI
ncbi:MAG: bifunctional chorismate mutase/prephenate dehydratase [Saccharofermentanales bacterium]